MKRARNVRAQRRALLVDKWQARAAQALGERRRGSRQIGVVKGKTRVGMKREDDARQPEDGKKRCWNWEEEGGHSLQVSEIGSQQEIRGGPSRNVVGLGSQ